METIQFTGDDGEVIDVYVVDETKLGGIPYLLVTDEPEGDATAFILKDVSAKDDPQACYVIVDDDDEMEAVARLFEEMVDDIAFDS